MVKKSALGGKKNKNKDVGQLSWFKGKPVVKKSALGGKKNKNKDVNMKREFYVFSI